MLKRTTLLFATLFVFFQSPTRAQSSDTVVYSLKYNSANKFVSITIEPPVPVESIEITIPRSAPGTYKMTNYDIYYQNIEAITVSSQKIKGEKGDGSYYTFESNSSKFKSISYTVDIEKMELELYSASASSKRRDDYLGLLGYSVFGVIPDFQENPIKLTIETDSDWPIFSTLAPSLNRKKGKSTYKTERFALLADGQYLLGKNLQLWSSTEGSTPLFVATYSETEVDLKEIGRRASISLAGLNEFYGFTPMPFYTVCYEFLNPITDKHNYGFSMEHMNSMTASLGTSAAVKSYDANPNIGSMIHHMGHAWVPLRSYGEGYRPFNWVTAPIIETIWLNEGFTWYIAYHEVLKSSTILDRFNRTLDEAPAYIQEMPLKNLSVLGSSQYSADFRIGRNLFSRGALIAAEMDELIKANTNGRKSFKDAALGLYRWTEKNKKAFEYDQIPVIMSKASDSDLSEVWNKWQKPPLRNKR